MHKPELAGITVLVTRPAHQAQGLHRCLIAHGAAVMLFPALAIAPCRDPQAARQRLAALAGVDILLFVSPNAVHYGMEYIRSGGGFPDTLAIGCVGKGSARALQQVTGQGPDLVPQQRYDSEALLALPELNSVRGKRVLIVRGEGGRETLAQSLRERGAEVDYAEVYRRTTPDQDPQPLRQALAEGSLDVVTVTSNEALENLLGLAGDQHRAALVDLPLVVVSARGAQQAQTLGFHNSIIEARNASDEGILEAVTDWARAVENTHE